MAKKTVSRGIVIASPIKQELERLGRLPVFEPTELILVPSFKMSTGRPLREDYPEEKKSYRTASDFLELKYPTVGDMDDYPLLSSPVYAFKCGLRPDSRYIEVMRLFNENIEIYYDEMDLIEFDSPNTSRYEAARLFRHFRPNGNFIVARMGDEDEFENVDADDLLKDTAPRERFYYSYALNFRKIGMHALRKAVTGIPVLTDLMDALPTTLGNRLRNIRRQDTSWSNDLVVAIARPEFLQVLYALAESTDDDLDALYGQLFDASRDYRVKTIGKRLQDGKWIGSGKHPPMKAPDLTNVLLALVAAGVVTIDPAQASVSVNPHGRKLLSSMHELCDDPDWLPVLFDKDGGLIAPPKGGVPAGDTWLMSHFNYMMAAAH